MTAASTVLHGAIVGVEAWFEGVEDSAALERAVYRGKPLARAAVPAPVLHPLCETLVRHAIAEAALPASARYAIVGTDGATVAEMQSLGGVSAETCPTFVRALRRTDEILESRTVDAVVLLSADVAGSETKRRGGTALVVVRRESRNTSRRAYALLDSMAVADDERWAAELALGEAGIEGQEVGYAELPWAADLDALAAALRSNTPTCAIGSVAATLGPTIASAGLLQACFALQRRYLPAAGPVAKSELPFDSAFYRPDESRPYFATAGSRRALIHTVDGSDSACVVLREAGATSPALPRYDPVATLTLLPIGARDSDELLTALNTCETRLSSGESLKKLAADLLNQDIANPDAPLAVALVGGTVAEIRAEIRAARTGVPKATASGVEWQTPAGSTFAPIPQGHVGQLAFVYPGAFSGYVGTARDAFRLFPWLLEPGCGLPKDLGSTFADELLYPRWRTEVSPQLRAQADGRFLSDHIAAFSASAGSAVLYTRIARDVFGIKPQMAFGYSLGEGSMFPSLGAWNDPDLQRSQLHASPLFRSRLGGSRDALRSFWKREEFPFQPVPLLFTYVVRTSADRVRAAMEGRSNVFLTIVNTPDEVVIGGLPAECAQLVGDLACDHLLVPYAQLLHSEVVATEETEIARLHSYPTQDVPQIAFYSATSPKPLTLERESLARTIARMSREPLDFPSLVERIWRDGARVFLELGAGSSCSRLISANLQGKPHLVVSMDRRGVDVQTAVIRCLARLVTHRVPLNLSPLIPSVVA